MSAVGGAVGRSQFGGMMRRGGIMNDGNSPLSRLVLQPDRITNSLTARS